MAERKQQAGTFKEQSAVSQAKKKLYVFPKDLEQADKGYYPDIMKITIIKRNGANLDKFRGKVKTDLVRNLKKDAGDKTNQAILKKLESSDGLSGAFSSAFEGVKNVVKEVSESGTLDSIDGSTTSIIAESISTTFSASKGETQVETIIALPMPDNLTYNEQLEWQASDLGALSGLAKGKSADNIAAAGFSQLGSIISGGAGALVSGVLGAGIAGGAVLGALGGGSTVQGTIESQLRIKANPFKEQTFQGVPFRPFEFSWTFSPRTLIEVNTIKDIINQIRGHSKPDYDGGSEFFFKYPHEFKIEFLTISDEDGQLYQNEYLPKLKNCICKSVNTNFATAGWYSFQDGAPTSITLQLQFEEVEIITHKDVLDDTSSEKGGF